MLTENAGIFGLAFFVKDFDVSRKPMPYYPMRDATDAEKHWNSNEKDVRHSRHCSSDRGADLSSGRCQCLPLPSVLEFPHRCFK